MKLTAHNIQQKMDKRLRYNIILKSMKKPITAKQLERVHKTKNNCLNHLLLDLKDQGYVIRLPKNGHSYLWQAINFDYREEGIDYDRPADDQERDERLQAHKPSLADPVYVHKPTHSRCERKSPRVYPSGAQTYA